MTDAAFADTVATPARPAQAAPVRDGDIAGGLAAELAGPGLVLRTGPYVYRIRSDVPAVAEGLALLYADYPRAPATGFVDFEVELLRSRGLRRWLRPQSRFRFDGTQSFEPLPLAQGFALLEWAMNWCVSSHVNHHLLAHAAVLERGGHALVMPAPPGSGKSTLTAALVHRGWRLLSDEIAVVPLDGVPGTAPRLLPIARPVGLKNASIDVIAGFEPAARVGRAAHGTAKGTVAHMQVPTAQVQRMDEPASARWIVFPRWQQGAHAVLSPRSRAQTLVALATQCFNAANLGLAGFRRLGELVDACDCHDFTYGQLDDAMAVFDALAQEAA